MSTCGFLKRGDKKLLAIPIVNCFEPASCRRGQWGSNIRSILAQIAKEIQLAQHRQEAITRRMRDAQHRRLTITWWVILVMVAGAIAVGWRFLLR